MAGQELGLPGRKQLVGLQPVEIPPAGPRRPLAWLPASILSLLYILPLLPTGCTLHTTHMLTVIILSLLYYLSCPLAVHYIPHTGSLLSSSA